MVKTLKDYVAYYKPTYEFVVKCQFEPKSDLIKKFIEETDNRFEIDKKTEVKRNAFKVDTDFNGEVIESWSFTVSYCYPVIDTVLEEIFKGILNVDNSMFKIRKANSAEIKDLEEKELKNEKEALLNQAESKPLEEVPFDELYGDDYNKKMLDALSSQEFKKISTVEEFKVKDQK